MAFEVVSTQSLDRKISGDLGGINMDRASCPCPAVNAASHSMEYEEIADGDVASDSVPFHHCFGGRRCHRLRSRIEPLARCRSVIRCLFALGNGVASAYTIG